LHNKCVLCMVGDTMNRARSRRLYVANSVPANPQGYLAETVCNRNFLNSPNVVSPTHSSPASTLLALEITDGNKNNNVRLTESLAAKLGSRSFYVVERTQKPCTRVGVGSVDTPFSRGVVCL
jgi:hypothetical protein